MSESKLKTLSLRVFESLMFKFQHRGLNRPYLAVFKSLLLLKLK